MKETPWIQGRFKPSREGVYKRKYFGEKSASYCLWKDGNWYFKCDNKQAASREKEISSTQNLPWRGLTTEGGK